MTIVVTAGPSWEPLDGMRRLTNASTGRLGSTLSDALTDAGHRVFLFRGEGATAPPPKRDVDLRSFGTNDDLAGALEDLGRRVDLKVSAVLHAAALCDFKVMSARASDGSILQGNKLPSRQGRLTLDLEPATKVLPRLRDWFPHAQILGWKYELDGGRDDALAAAWRQLREARSDACILNGAAWGTGFALCEAPAQITICADAANLADALLAFLGKRAA